MTHPKKYLVRMALFLLAVAGVGAVLAEPLSGAFLANPALNGLILGVLLLGIIYNFRQVLTLAPEVAWIENFRSNRQALSSDRPPRLLSPMATMLGEKRDRLSLSALAMRSLLDGISMRLDESRDISRYTVGLLIFLGLLGTFWGLLATIASIGDVIAGLGVSGVSDVSAVFGELKKGLEAPLAGMGTAFSSSLFGLAGSLVLGFLDLQASQAQNRFYNDLEEWLSGLTRLSSGVLGGDGEGGTVPAYVQALLEQTAESLETLQRTMARGEDERLQATRNLGALVDRLEVLTEQMRTEQTLMLKLAEGQADMKPLLIKLSEAGSKGAIDEATRNHIRNMDVYLARLGPELSAGREELTQQMRAEFRLLTRTIAAIADEGER